MRRLQSFRNCLAFLAAFAAIVGLPFLAPCADPTAAKAPKWEATIRAFENSDKTNQPPKNATLFTGSSSIVRWKSLAEDFPDRKVINRGFGGSFLEDVATYADRVIVAYHPATVVIYAGGNDINGGRTPEQVFESFKSIMSKIRPALPQAHIFYISIAPNIARWAQIEKVRAANRLIEGEIKAMNDPKVEFIDVAPGMLGEDGKPKPDIFVADNLHMNPKGYAIWTSIVGPRVK
jgi:lysophospholipase L1-like esterase